MKVFNTAPTVVTASQSLTKALEQLEAAHAAHLARADKLHQEAEKARLEAADERAAAERASRIFSNISNLLA